MFAISLAVGVSGSQHLSDGVKPTETLIRVANHQPIRGNQENVHVIMWLSVSLHRRLSKFDRKYGLFWELNIHIRHAQMLNVIQLTIAILMPFTIIDCIEYHQTKFMLVLTYFREALSHSQIA